MFRRGQWVKTNKEVKFPVGSPEAAGAVGIHVGNARRFVPDPGADVGTWQDVPGVAEVHMVDFPKGETRRVVGIAYADLEPCLSKDELPADRMTTAMEGFEPRP